MSDKKTPPREPGDDHDEDPMPFASPPKAETALVPQTETHDATFVDPKTTVARRSIFGDEIETSRESVAVAAQVKALIAARTGQAMAHPRSFDDARIAILKDCRRPAFAKAAIFRKPVGGSFIEGLSIRFAESAMRHWGNIASEAILLYDQPDKRIVRICLVDLESNTWHSRDITLLKTVERKTLKNGQVAISERVNSKGEITYEVMATEDELATKEAAARSKIMRNEGLRLLPADILDEAKAICMATRKDSDASDPDAARKEIADGFAELSILPSDIESFIGCPLGQASPAQLGELREVYRAVRDGDATWAAFMAARSGDIQPDGEEDQKSSRVDALKQRAKANQAARKGAK